MEKVVIIQKHQNKNPVHQKSTGTSHPAPQQMKDMKVKTATGQWPNTLHPDTATPNERW